MVDLGWTERSGEERRGIALDQYRERERECVCVNTDGAEKSAERRKWKILVFVENCIVVASTRVGGPS